MALGRAHRRTSYPSFLTGRRRDLCSRTASVLGAAFGSCALCRQGLLLPLSARYSEGVGGVIGAFAGYRARTGLCEDVAFAGLVDCCLGRPGRSLAAAFSWFRRFLIQG